MRNFVDFGEVKERVSFADAIHLLALTGKAQGNQWRGPCPACNQGGDRAIVVTEGRGFYCFAEKKGGDVIALAAHVLDLPAKEAALELARRAGIVPVPSTSTSTVPRPESEGAAGSKLTPLSYLQGDHEAVVALGLDTEFCAKHGIGYAPRGVVRGSVAIPFRDERGTLLGYFGVQELTYVPADFQPTNIIPFAQRRA